MSEPRSTTVQEEDGTTSVYDEVPVEGDRVERLLRELFSEHWSRLTVGPVIEGAAWEVRFTAAPRLGTMDGYLTVDTGSWHFHLCVGETGAGGRPARARVRRVGRAAFFRTEGGSCSPESYGLRLWNGRGEQMVTIFFPSPFHDDAGHPLRPPDPTRTALWEDVRRRYRT
jgi:hypothetical protein